MGGYLRSLGPTDNDIVLEDLEARGRGGFKDLKGNSSLVDQLLSGAEAGHEKIKKV